MNFKNFNREVVARAWFMNVGNGDCTILVDSDSHRALVVDCPSAYVEQVRDLLEAEHATLDTCIVTHWDADHYGGLANLAVALPVSRVLYNHDTLFEGPDSPPFAIRGALKRFLDIPEASAKLAPALAGSAGNVGKVSWTILAPNYHELTMAYTSHKRNLASAVVEIAVSGTTILIGGDAVARTWQRLLKESAISADILRWPHHGAALAGDISGVVMDRMLRAIRPRYVVLSAGTSNSYGHPSFDVVRKASTTSVVMCTQVTSGCFGFERRGDRLSDEAKRVMTDLPSRHCAGTVGVMCFEGGFSLSPASTDHESRVRLWSAPMCRVGDISMHEGEEAKTAIDESAAVGADAATFPRVAGVSLTSSADAGLPRQGVEDLSSRPLSSDGPP